MKPSFAVLLGRQGPYVQQSDEISLDKLYCHIEIQHTFIEMILCPRHLGLRLVERTDTGILSTTSSSSVTLRVEQQRLRQNNDASLG